MVRKLKKKLVLFFMAFATLVIVLTMLFVCISVARNNAAINEAQLQSVLRQNQSFYESDLDRYSSVSFSYLTVEVMPSGKAYVNGDLADNLSEDELLTIINEVISSSDSSGVLEEEHLRYYAESSVISTRIAFMDNRSEQLALRKMVLSCLLIGICALVVLFFIAVLLSRIATKPVENAWTQQKQFLSDASHELKTPLTVILSSADLLQTGVSGKMAEYVDNIQAESYRMKDLVDGMLTLSRLERTPEITFNPVDFSDVVTDSCLHFEPLAFEKGHTIQSNITPDIFISGDVHHLARLCGILLDNAIKYADAHTPITVSLTQSAKTVTLSVTNQCQPIPEEKLSHLFDRFYRADDSRTGAEGFGLGLSIAKKITELHGGKITCVSGDTTTFKTEFTQSR